MRLEWHPYFLGIAVAVSVRGDCIRRQVGAVLVDDETKRILATGYNGSEPGGKSCLAGECPRCLSDAPSGSSYDGCIERHAERNVIEFYKKYFPYGDLEESTLYVTTNPCTDCEPMLLDEQVGGIVYPGGIWERVWWTNGPAYYYKKLSHISSPG